MTEKTPEQLKGMELKNLTELKKGGIIGAAELIKRRHGDLRVLSASGYDEDSARSLHNALKDMKGKVHRAMELLAELHGVESEEELPLMAANGVREG